MIRVNINKYFLKLFYFLLRKKWLITLEDPLQHVNLKKNNFFLENKEINPPEKQKIWFISEKKIKKGWYFFGILHFGENKNCITKISSSPYYKQGRPTFPFRRRWRVIRNANRVNLIFEISQIKSSIKIKEIWLIPIPFLFAWKKIRRKIINFSSYNFIKSIYKPFIWRKYNRIFEKQIKKHQKFNYQDWIKHVEKSLLKKLKNKSKKSSIWTLLENLDQVELKKVNWVIAKKQNSKLSKNINDIVNFINTSNEKIDIAYGDEDHISNYNQRSDPIFKPSWNRELFWSDPFYSSHWIISFKLFNEVFKKPRFYKNITYEELTFKLIEYILKKKRSSNIKHLPFIVSHRLSRYYNFYDNYFLEDYKKKLFKHISEVISQNIKVKEDNLDRRNLFITWPLPKKTLLTVIIPTKDKLSLLERCINSLYKYSPGCDLEIIIVNNNSFEKSTHIYLDEFKEKSTPNCLTKVINYHDVFNYSKINNLAVQKSSGDTILLLNNDVEFKTSNWGINLASNAHRSDIGCVGAKLLFEDNTVQHAGVILGIGGVAGHSHKYFNSNSEGYCRRLNLVQEYCAVTAACLCITKFKWLKIGGLDEINLSVNYNDVDFCLRARQHNLKNIYLPYVKALHLESKTRGKPQGETYIQWRKEYKFMQKKWTNLLHQDPFYSPHLSKLEEDWSISINETDILIR